MSKMSLDSESSYAPLGDNTGGYASLARIESREMELVGEERSLSRLASVDTECSQRNSRTSQESRRNSRRASCDIVRGKQLQEMTTTHVASRKSLFVVEEKEDIEDVKAIVMNLLKYLSVDPDGGLANLEDSEMRGSTGQTSKMHLLEKTPLRSFSASVTLIGIFLNVFAVLHSSSHVLLAYIDPDFKYRDRHSSLGFSSFSDDRVSSRINLPIAELMLGVALVECTRGGWIISRCIMHAFKFWHARRGASALSRACKGDALCHEDVGKSHHMYLAKIFWEDFHTLKTFSALRALALVHPAVIGHYAKDMTLMNDVSRALFERCLRVPPDHTSTDEELHGEISVLMVWASDVDDEEQRNQLALKYLSLGSYELLSELELIPRERLESALAKLTENGWLNAHSVDLDALGRTWRVHFFAYLEQLMFWLAAAFFFLFGSSAFLVKTCRAALILIDSDIDPVHTAFHVALFMNQVLGIMSVGHLLRWRIFRFVFGGQDANVSNEEKYVQKLYMALLAQRIWESHHLTCFRKLVIMITFDDDDLQRLVLEEAGEEKAKVMLQVKAAMDKAGISHGEWKRAERWVRE